MKDRRIFIKTLAMTSGALFVSRDIFSKPEAKPEPAIACQQYTWYSYYLREGKSWMKDPNASLDAFNESGLRGYEPSFENPADVSSLKKSLNKHKIWSKSMYVNSVLYEPQLAEQNIAEVMAIAKEAEKAGIEILVTNPTPLSWGGKENKNDEQLKAQAIALNLLGKQLNDIGMTLAYHNHDAEMRESAREFHHMLRATEPAYVKLCLDAHWIYRGSGNSQVALFDIVDMYADRIVELHLRQSHDGIWSEVFEEGDIDYGRLAKALKQKNINPNIVLEQAVETGTPNTMDTVEAMSKSLANVKDVFADFS